MKHTTLFLVALFSAIGATARQNATPAQSASASPAASSLQNYAPEMRTVMTVAQARMIVGKFSEAYAKLGRPRVLFYVARDLVDGCSNLQLARQAEAERGKGRKRDAAESAASSKSRASLSLTDRQTIREVERLFGRPFRAVGAQFADQTAAAALIGDKPFEHFTASGSDQARKDREALAQVADIVVEVLISTREVLLPRISQDRTFTVPDIQATAIRLSDAAILGQASSRDIMREQEPGRAVYRFNVNEIAEATALALMEDMALGHQ